jgi:DNA-binding CsgD family transcriptional regulator
MVDGHHYKTAAREMGISTSTVSFHLKHLSEAAGALKSEAVAKALRERLI